MRSSVTYTVRRPAAMVHLRGELDVGTAADVRDGLRSVHSQGGVDIQLELADVTFFDAATIGQLVAAKKRALAAGGSFEIIHPSRSVTRVLRLLHLDPTLGSLHHRN